MSVNGKQLRSNLTFIDASYNPQYFLIDLCTARSTFLFITLYYI